MKISEIITDKYKLRISPTVYYELLADVQEAEEKQEPVLDKIRAEIKALTSNRGFLSCSVDSIHEEIDAVFDKYKAETEA